MYIGRALRCASVYLCVCVCLSVHSRVPTLLHVPGYNLANGIGCPLVVYYWVDLHVVHQFCFCDSIARTLNVSECLYSLCARLRFLFIITETVHKQCR